MRKLALATTVLIAACDPAVDPPPPAAHDPVALSGTYQVTSDFQVPATVAAPGPLGDALRLLHEMNVNPGGAILTMAEIAGVPAVGDLRAVLPQSLEDQLTGWMNQYLDTATVNGVSPHDEIVALDEQVRSVLLDWDLRSTLDLPVSAPGTHAPDALVFGAGGNPVVVPVDLTAPVTAGTGVSATVSWPSGGGSPTVTIGEHAMGIPFGHYALIAIDVITEAEFGTPGVGAALHAIVDCAGMAASVAAQCTGPSWARVCVGHETELTAVCEGGLDAVAAKLEEKILGIDYQAIHFVSGIATVEGVSVDETTSTATATVLSNGTWTSTIDLAQGGTEDATATFTATR